MASEYITHFDIDFKRIKAEKRQRLLERPCHQTAETYFDAYSMWINESSKLKFGVTTRDDRPGEYYIYVVDLDNEAWLSDFYDEHYTDNRDTAEEAVTMLTQAHANQQLTLET